jgi:hypothetical protein
VPAAPYVARGVAALLVRGPPAPASPPEGGGAGGACPLSTSVFAATAAAMRGRLDARDPRRGQIQRHEGPSARRAAAAFGHACDGEVSDQCGAGGTSISGSVLRIACPTSPSASIRPLCRASSPRDFDRCSSRRSVAAIANVRNRAGEMGKPTVDREPSARRVAHLVWPAGS